MELVIFNPTFAKSESVGSPTVTPAPILREGWTVGGYSVGLNLSDGAGEVSAAFLAPPGVRALTVSFTAKYMRRAESNWHPMTWIDAQIRVTVGRINSSQSFRMFNTRGDEYDDDSDYHPDPPEGTRDVQLDIDTSKIVVRINGSATLELVPDESIAIDDYVTGIYISFPAGDHTYSSDPYEQTAALFGVTNFVISPASAPVPPAFWTSLVGTKETA